MLSRIKEKLLIVKIYGEEKFCAKKVCYSYGTAYHSKYILDRIYLLYINIIV